MRWKPPLLTGLLEDRSGAVLIYVGVAMTIFVAVAALVIDMSHAYWTNNRLQIAADAAALAGASQLPSADGVVKAEAKRVAIANIVNVGGTTVLNEVDDVTIGCWDGAQFAIMPCSPSRNAVRVVTQRSSANDNPLATTFGKALGTDAFNLARMAVAEATPEECLIDGLIAEGIVEMGSANTLDGVCMHGQDGFKIGSDNDLTDAALSMGPGGDVDAGGNNSGLEDPMPVRDLPPSDAIRIDEILADIAAGNGPWPDYLSGVVVAVSSLPGTRVNGVLYIVDNDVTLSGSQSGFGVYSKKKITISSDAVLHGMFLASRENVEAGSNIEFGDPDFCTDGTGAVFMAAADQVKLGSNNHFTGVQIIAGNYVDMGSNLMDVAGLAVQSGGDIKMGSAEVSECERTTHALLGGSTKILHLVQ